MHTALHTRPGDLPGITRAAHLDHGRVCVYLGDVDIYADAHALRQWLTGTLEALDEMTAEHYRAEADKAADLRTHVRASDEQNRAGLARARAALHAVGDPNPEVTIGFVGERTALAQAQAQRLAEGLGALGLVDNGTPAAYNRAERRGGRRS